MPAATLVPVEEYLSTSYRPDCEYLDGVILERNLGEFDHSRLQGLLYGYLLRNERAWLILALPEQRVQVAARRFRVPDVCAISPDQPREQIITRPPILCVEILSKDDRMSEMKERVNDYLRFGVPCVWVIDPRLREAHIFIGSRIEPVQDGILRVPNTPIEVPLAEVLPKP